MTFPAETESQENRKEVGRVSRRASGAEIFKSLDDVKRNDVGDEETKRQQREYLREQRRKHVSNNLSLKLRQTNPKFMSDDDLEAKAKGVSQRLRDEERKAVEEQELLERPPAKTSVLKLPQPEPEPQPQVSTDESDFEEEVDSDDEFEDAIEYTKPTRDNNRLLANLVRYRDEAEHFGHNPVDKDRSNLVAKLQRLQQAKKDRVRASIGPPPPPRPPTDVDDFLSGINENPLPEAPPVPPRNPRTIETQTPPQLPPRDVGNRERAERLIEGNKSPPRSSGRYARGSTSEYLGIGDKHQLTTDRDEIAKLKGYLSNFGFSRTIFDTSSKKDRDKKDIEIAKKLSELRNSPEYQKIQDSVAEAIMRSKRIGRLQTKGSQLKKKKK